MFKGNLLEIWIGVVAIMVIFSTTMTSGSMIVLANEQVE
ncbi:hypothetical protein A5844_000492 [Enterococcus sp. 10A9_DIV0425]|uniref:Uncharacterized protein n=1 Tax=Candidatus Enterococcus wittei TaxID=1987383 RepID=A0A2C9XQ01_9ENTE|nr:hypothetical protein A5844_000492 [Enterococcus sp. 10A9_DIV0425]